MLGEAVDPKRTNSAFLSVSGPKESFGDGIVHFAVSTALVSLCPSEALERLELALQGLESRKNTFLEDWATRGTRTCTPPKVHK